MRIPNVYIGEILYCICSMLEENARAKNYNPFVKNWLHYVQYSTTSSKLQQKQFETFLESVISEFLPSRKLHVDTTLFFSFFFALFLMGGLL